MLEHLGIQLVIEYFNCNKDIINSPEKVKKIMEEAATKAGANIVASVFHHFNPHGVSGAVIISESHLTIHTWPEYGYVSMDIYTCGDTIDPWTVFPFLKKSFMAEKGEVVDLPRGSAKKIKLFNPLIKTVEVK